MATSGEKRENSVLFSLRELRQIEDSRVQEEQDAARSAEEARIRTKMEEERRRREEEEARIKAEQDEERRIREEAQRREHEGNIRVQEAQVRAQAEHNAKLEQDRLQHEMDIRRQEVAKKRPTWLLVVAGVLVVAIGVSIYLIIQHQKSQEQAERQQKEAEDLAAQQQAEFQKQQDAYKTQIAELTKQLNDEQDQLKKIGDDLDSAVESLQGAKTDAERKAAGDRISNAKQRKHEVEQKQDDTRKKINLSEECLKNPLGCH